jgi:hypothetical protein
MLLFWGGVIDHDDYSKIISPNLELKHSPKKGEFVWLDKITGASAPEPMMVTSLNTFRAANVENLIKLLRPKSYILGLLFFGLLHENVQQHLSRFQ